MLKYLFSLWLCIVGITLPSVHSQSKTAKIRTIIIDAGHGGTDPGAKGDYSTEGQLTLEMSLKLEKLLIAELPDTKILMTRTTDVFQKPGEKADFANKNNGDLFVSIHVNAAPKIRHSEITGYKTQTYYKGKGKARKKYTKKVPQYRVWYTPNPAHGTSTYVWASDRNDNKGEAISERFESETELSDIPDPNSPESLIAQRLWSQKFFKNSVKLGTLIEEEFTKVGRNSAGVRQRNEKGIWVLQATAMPSVLVETGFITDKDEESYLNSEAGQNEIVRSVANALIAYKIQIETPRTTPTATGNRK
jgi:N-acetylmuramoyl-L-alanine amidase